MFARPIRAIIDAGGNSRVAPGELLDSVLPDIGDTRGKSTAFWSLLVCSSIIAAIGVLTDSTATVIGAMVIAPLGTPIYGVAAALVAGVNCWPVALRLFGGILVPIAIGALCDVLMLDLYPVDANPQILARTNPSLPDLAVALATGLAGALALARRDISPALPGVAIAISLVPPLGVVGITLANGRFELALGALLLFATNLLAIIGASLVVFASAGIRAADGTDIVRSPKASALLVVVAVGVLASLTASTVRAGSLLNDQLRVQQEALEWDRDHDEWHLQDVERQGSKLVVTYLGDRAAQLDRDALATGEGTERLDATLLEQLRRDGVEVDVQFIQGGRLGLVG